MKTAAALLAIVSIFAVTSCQDAPPPAPPPKPAPKKVAPKKKSAPDDHAIPAQGQPDSFSS